MNTHILRKTQPIIALLICCSSTFAQTLSAESQGIAGIQSTSTGSDAIWHNFALLSHRDIHLVHITSAMPFLIDGIVRSGIGASTNLGSRQCIGVRVESIFHTSYRSNSIGVVWSRPLSPNTALGLAIDQRTERLGAERLWATSYTLCASHDLNDMLTIGFTLKDPMPLSKGTSSTGSFNGGLKWSLDAVNLYFELQKRVAYRLSSRWAIDYSPIDRLTLRFGISTSPATVHFGFSLPCTMLFTVHLAVAYHTILGITPTLSISYPRT